MHLYKFEYYAKLCHFFLYIFVLFYLQMLTWIRLTSRYQRRCQACSLGHPPHTAWYQDRTLQDRYSVYRIANIISCVLVVVDMDGT